MAKASSEWICQQCGYVSSGFLGKCPNCSAWGSLVETQTISASTTKSQKLRSTIKPVNLKEVSLNPQPRLSTGIEELDHVLGGGLVPGMVILLAGEPGIGKSTLLLQVVHHLLSNPKEKSSKPILYVSGEESAQQIALRATRLQFSTDKLDILCLSDTDAAISQITTQYSLVIVDSIQTLTTQDLVGTAGSVGQVRESAFRFIQTAKREHIPLILVGHVTKEGAIAGPKILEHMVDTVLYFEGERYQSLRLLRTTKNRFGATDEVGVFTMTQTGLEEVKNPSASFLEETQTGIPGSCLTCIMEGTRPLIVEVQALVVASGLAQPRRVASGINWDRLQLDVAVLTKRANLPLGGYDIFINVAGGVKIEEPAADLAICLALASAYFDKPAGNLVAVGEVGLLGEVRSVRELDKRMKEATKLGYKTFVGPQKGISIKDLIRQIFSSPRR